MRAAIIEMPDRAPHIARQLDGMFRLRHEVFGLRLAWDVGSKGGRERDPFDDLDPVYIVCEQDGEVLGSWRLLPTTGPYMLKDVFPQLLYGTPPPVSRHVWEISRFAVSKRAAGGGSLGTVRAVTQLLLEQLFSFAARRRITRIIAVSEVRFERVLGRAGLLTERFGPPLRIGKTMAVSGFADVSDLNLRRLQVAAAAARDPAPRLRVAA